MLRAPKVDVSKLVEGAGGAEVLAKATGHVATKVVVQAPSDMDAGVKVAADAKPAAAEKSEKADKPEKADKAAAAKK